MAKKNHSFETFEILDDLENRIRQFVEVNRMYQKGNETLIENQERAFNSVLDLIGQIRGTGKVKRETNWEKEGRSGKFPDPIEAMVTKNPRPPRLL